MAEALLNEIGKGRFRGYSAGSHPAGRVNSFALELLRRNDHPVDPLRSKSWDEFAAPGAPRMDFVITVCDKAAGEMCPLWPAQPVSAHWGFEDPAAFEGTDEQKRERLMKTYREIMSRVRIFAGLPIERLDRMSLQQQVRDIGKTAP
jgi:arsenate reductase